MTLDDLDTTLDQAPVKEPSKRWKNRYRAKVDRDMTKIPVCMDCFDLDLRYIKKGDVFEGHCRVFPSKEIAENTGFMVTSKSNCWREFVESFSID